MSFETIRILSQGSKVISFPCSNTSHCHPIEVIFPIGTFFLELWGSGLYSSGGYVSGEIHFYSPQILYCFIGGVAPGGTLSGLGGYNGGGTSHIIGSYNGGYRQMGGHGATDFRLEFDDLSSRIIVAGGAGGGFSTFPGGYGGGLIGGNGATNTSSNTIIGEGGNQTAGGRGQHQGDFGTGGSSSPAIHTDLAGCGGGGWYGGGSGYHSDLHAAGGGGSSYVSGHMECDNHSSGLRFYNAIIHNGSEEMPSPLGGLKIGPIGNGFVRITCIDRTMTCQFVQTSIISHLFVVFFLTGFYNS